MPEMPEVKTAAKYINQDVQNKRILEAKILVSKMVKDISVSSFEEKIKDKTINYVTHIGKYLIFALNQNLIMISHLRMEGRYRFSKELQLNKHDHAWFKFKDGYLIYQDTRKFGTFNLKTYDNFLKTPPLNKLGFLAEDIDLNYFHHQLKRKKIAIKSALLDQSIIIGLGNIYVDEVLWASKIHPQTKSCNINLKMAKLILENTSKILKIASENGGSSIKTYVAYNKILGKHQDYLKVHMQKNKPCPNCQTLISKIKVNGRGTYFCLQCQKLENLKLKEEN